jgi:hypothetical protein
MTKKYSQQKESKISLRNLIQTEWTRFDTNWKYKPDPKQHLEGGWICVWQYNAELKI